MKKSREQETLKLWRWRQRINILYGYATFLGIRKRNSTNTKTLPIGFEGVIANTCNRQQLSECICTWRSIARSSAWIHRPLRRLHGVRSVFDVFVNANWSEATTRRRAPSSEDPRDRRRVELKDYGDRRWCREVASERESRLVATVAWRLSVGRHLLPPSPTSWRLQEVPLDRGPRGRRRVGCRGSVDDGWRKSRRCPCTQWRFTFCAVR